MSALGALVVVGLVVALLDSVAMALFRREERDAWDEQRRKRDESLSKRLELPRERSARLRREVR